MTAPDFSKPRQKAQPNFDRVNTTAKRGARHEKRVAARTGDRRVSGSGNKPGKPADIRGEVFLTECKTSGGVFRGINSSKSRMIDADDLAKIVNQALAVGRVPQIKLCFEAQQVPIPTEWVFLPAIEFERLVGGNQ